jgi:hypothetical protein
MSDDLSEELARNIPLSEMIQSLRQELAVSIANSAGVGLRFKIEAIELELQVQVSRDRNVEGRLAFGVIQAGGKRGVSQQDTHTFRLKLKPEATDGKPVLVSDQARSLPRQPGI